NPVETVEEKNPSEDTGPAGDAYRMFYRADKDKVEELIKAIIELKKGQLITTNKEKQSTFKVLGNIVGTEVKIYDQNSNIVGDIILGDQGSTMMSTYVRVPDSDEIREVPGALKMIFKQTLMNLRDKKVFEAPPETISSVTTSNNKINAGFTLARVEGAWLGKDNQGNELKPDAEKMDDLLEKINSMSVNQYVDFSDPRMRSGLPEGTDENDPWGLLNPTITLEFTTSDGKTQKLYIGREEGTTFYAATDANMNDIFKLSSTIVEGISPDPSTLVKSDESADTSAIIPADQVRESAQKPSDAPIPIPVGGE
ncbi:MAG: DUF4340 domain-containing protein, partial [bacterium]